MASWTTRPQPTPAPVVTTAKWPHPRAAPNQCSARVSAEMSFSRTVGSVTGHLDADEVVRCRDDVERPSRSATSRLAVIGRFDDQAAGEQWPRQAGEARGRQVEAARELPARHGTAQQNLEGDGVSGG